MHTLFSADGHRNLMFDDLGVGTMVQSNQHIIIDGNEAMLLDPGGHKVYSALFAKSAGALAGAQLKQIFFSHQDPDIIAAANGWLMMTDATAYLSALWMRFITHFGVDDFVVKRIVPIPDEGMTLPLGGTQLKLIPAHFLHSPGNFQVYDPRSRILYTGDLGVSLGQPYAEVTDVAGHVQYMEGFHRRYIAATKSLKMWVRTVRTLDVEIIAPQHGAIFPNRAAVGQLIDWLDGLTCGVDLMGDAFVVPA